MKLRQGVPVVVEQKRIQLGTMRLQVRSLVLLSGLRIRHCHELWYRSQTRLRSHIALAVEQAGGYSSDSAPSLGTAICCGSSPIKRKKKKKKTRHLDSFHCYTSTRVKTGVPTVAQETNLTSIHEARMQVSDLAQILHCRGYGVGQQLQLQIEP